MDFLLNFLYSLRNNIYSCNKANKVKKGTQKH